MSVEHGGAPGPRALIPKIAGGVLLALVVGLLSTGLTALWHWAFSVPLEPLLPTLAATALSLALVVPFCLYCLLYRGAHLGGIIYRYAETNDRQVRRFRAMAQAKHSLRYVGISHRTLLDPRQLLLKAISCAAENCSDRLRVEFYFLDPDCAARAEREQDEGDSVGTFVNHIEGAQTHLRHWAEKYPDTVDLHIYIYTSYPVFRYCLIDNSQAFVSVFPRKGAGAGVPIYRIKRERGVGNCLLDFFARRAPAFLQGVREV
jgi:hypothetical protein